MAATMSREHMIGSLFTTWPRGLEYFFVETLNPKPYNAGSRRRLHFDCLHKSMLSVW